jgi:BirA family biotin operon repressor/biotin-[acetyl-CoA-carboxylase] ligase
LSRNDLTVELGSIAHRRGVRLVVHDNIDSTNSEGKRLVLSGEHGPVWIVAKEQTAGRGRLGRSWDSALGNLHASFVVSDFGPTRIAPQLGLVAGVATLSALQNATNAKSRLALKWPNDILLDGMKLGGILLEAVTLAVSESAYSQAMAAVIGVGVNCASSPSGLPYPATDLAVLGADAPSAAMVLRHLSDAMIETLDIWSGGDGFPRLRERWLAHASGLGGRIRVALAQEIVEGCFTTIDSDGRLVLATERGERIIEAGDVLFRRNEDDSDNASAFVERLDRRE